MAVINQQLFVDGTLRAGNIAAGKITIEVSGAGQNTVFSATVTGLSLVGSGNLFPQVTPWTVNPGGRPTSGSTGHTGVIETSVASVSSTGFIIYMNRTTNANTVVLWFATRNP